MKQLCSCILLTVLMLPSVYAAAPVSEELSLREKARKEMNAGNYKDALDLFTQLLFEKGKDRSQLANDLNAVMDCLRNLNRIAERDELLEKAVVKHAENWHVLKAAAQEYMNGDHNGFLVAGKFERGHHRGGGKYVGAYERDRIRALQLMAQAAEKVKDADDSTWDKSSFYMEFAGALMGNRGYGEAWRLQTLSDLSVLPDYEEGRYYYGYYGGEQRRAPVDADGNPVYYREPSKFDAAVNDGERWRWLLAEAVRVEKGRRDEAELELAKFFHNQFGTETIAQWSWGEVGAEAEEGNESGPYELHTLKDNETIARLATGVKRFRIPDEFNYIRLYKDIADRGKSGYGETCLDSLAQIYENRRQFPSAVEYWTRSKKEYDDANEKRKEKRITQIVGNWGRFAPGKTQPAGREGTVDYIFRNGTSVRFEAHEIDVKKLLGDMKSYLSSNPKDLDWERMQLGDLGYRLVTKGQDKYLGARAAVWSLELEPKNGHMDRRVEVKAPLNKAGAYLVTAQLKDGNTSRIVLWLDDTVIARKNLDGKTGLLVADSVTGTPLAGVEVECFGYRQKHVEGRAREYEVIVDRFTEKTDSNGWLLMGKDRQSNQNSWLYTVMTPAGRVAYLGFDHVWFGNQYDAEYNQRKVFLITDRPVYRPNQSVKIKMWITQAKYDAEGNSPFVGQKYALIVTNPKGEKVYDKTFTADEYGGIGGEFTLPKDSQLGSYHAYALRENQSWGGGNFRVEEYKKPEFEVSVDGPAEPVQLGEKISATVKAKYYFGSPVTEANIKYKVLRSEYTARWYPRGIWDWFYEPGYWWFSYDYDWYPGWKDWGFRRPFCSWWPMRSQAPELVAEGEAAIGNDGTYKIELDTAMTAKMHGDKDHQYSITAEVTDQSRRTIVGESKVLVARKPFQVYAWVDRGHYKTGDAIQASFSAQTLDNKPVKGKGVLKVVRITYKQDAERVSPVEDEVHKQDLDTGEDGTATVQLQAGKAGQYRLSYTVKDDAGHKIEGGYVFCVTGEGFDGNGFHFSRIEMVPEKKEYAAGERVRLLINTEQENSTVFLFVRAANGVCPEPRVLRLKGKSTVEEIDVSKKDMPNFFIEAMTISDGRVHSEVREIAVPPEKRVVDVKVTMSSQTYKPGQEAQAVVKVTDADGKPVVGAAVASVYDKAVEYISGGSNVREIRAFFWKWRRHHNPSTMHSLERYFQNTLKEKEEGMAVLGLFGDVWLDGDELAYDGGGHFGRGEVSRRLSSAKGYAAPASVALAGSPMPAAEGVMFDAAVAPASAKLRETSLSEEEDKSGGAEGQGVEPAIRSEFADTAFWAGDLKTDSNGEVRVTFKMPENLTTWKTRVWVMGEGTRVGEGTAEVVTAKNLILRLQAPRFFVEKDEVILSANIHNYLAKDKEVTAVLELGNSCLEAMDKTSVKVKVDAGGEKRVDWKVKVAREGEAVIRMKALTDEESDAMEMKFPVYVHGMNKMDSYCGVIRTNASSVAFTITVPEQRRVEETRLEVRYSPTLAGALVDALPYLGEYPYGCTEQTLNRFLPAVITQNILKQMGLDLKKIGEKRTNLNAQEIGKDEERAKQWKRWDRDPVFETEVLQDMVKTGVRRLVEMQCSDGGWGWFSGWGEYSSPHTTAYVVHGLQMAAANGVDVPKDSISRGVEWLLKDQKEEVTKIRNAEKKKTNVPSKPYADNMDAFTFMVLTDAGKKNSDMLDYLYRDRKELSVYGKAMFGLALHKLGEQEKLDMILKNIGQFVKEDNENQTAWLELGNEGYWWCWYGSENEAHAYYLKLLARTDPKGDLASRLVKYLLNNRKNGTYWNSTRDTALCIEAMADFIKASEEDKPDMTVEVYVDGQKMKEEIITAENLFLFDNKFELSGTGVKSGKHVVELRRKGKGPLYCNAYVSYFTLEDYIKKAGLEVKVNRTMYKLIPVEGSTQVSGSRGQSLTQKKEKFKREELKDLQMLKSGDLVEVELVIDSKNDYEYLVFEDMKAAGFEPVEVRSGYNGNEMGAYVEFRDERVCFFVRSLARGKHSVTYRIRAEIPGQFSALPTRGSAMYAPELRANSDEIKLKIED